MKYLKYIQISEIGEVESGQIKKLHYQNFRICLNLYPETIWDLPVCVCGGSRRVPGLKFPY